jgi:putative ABC transport system permease protein
MLEYAIRELVRRYRRTLITVSGYLIAVAFSCLLLSAVKGAEEASGTILKSTGTHFIAFIPACSGDSCPVSALDAEHEGFYAGTTPTRPLNNSLIDGIKALSSVADAAPCFVYRMINGPSGEALTIAGILSGESRATATNCCSASEIVEGRFFFGGNERGVILAHSYAETASLSVGDTLTLGGTPHTVIGTIEAGIKPVKADVYMSIAEAESLIRPRVRGEIADSSNVLMIESAGSNTHKDAMNDVRRVMGAEALLSSYNCYKPAAMADIINRNGANAAALLVYLCILVFSLQSELHSVTERKHEIGIVSSIGWSRGDIVSQIALESALKAFAGWAIGSLIATAIILLVPASPDGGGLRLLPQLYLYSLLLTLVSGVVAGIVPGLVAANRKPAEDLRKY